uniref:Uncharacterized protein n=1 Tax=Arundo donax TaxID=35708 RepID=A0A0A9DY18_ARUDO
MNKYPYMELTPCKYIAFASPNLVTRRYMLQALFFYFAQVRRES